MREAAELRRAIQAYLESPPPGSPDLSGRLRKLDAALEKHTKAPTPPRTIAGSAQHPNTGSRLRQASARFQKAAPEQKEIVVPLEIVLRGLTSPGQRQVREITAQPNHSGQIPEGTPPEFASTS